MAKENLLCVTNWILFSVKERKKNIDTVWIDLEDIMVSVMKVTGITSFLLDLDRKYDDTTEETRMIVTRGWGRKSKDLRNY